MASATDVWDLDEMKSNYGKFYEENRKLALNKNNIPEEFWPMLGYAEFWGIADDSRRETLVRNAPHEVKQNLKAVVARFDNALDKWMAGPEADKLNPSDEYIAFSAMRMAAYLV